MTLLEEIDGFLEVLEARSARNASALVEASLGRILQHYMRSDEQSFGIVTSWKDISPSLSPKEQNEKFRWNLERYRDLKKWLRSQGLGFVELSGKWFRCECLDHSKESCVQCPQDQKKFTIVNEPSVFVPGLTKDQAKEIRSRYDQDAVLWGGPEVIKKFGGGASLVTRDEEEIPLGTLQPGKTADIYSTVRGRPFTFEWVAQTPTEKILERVWNHLSNTRR